VERRMRQIVAEDAPITRERVTRPEAIEVYESRGEEDKARLAGSPRTDWLTLYRLHERRDYLQGYMVPSTGCLTHFSLHTLPTGSCCGSRISVSRT